MEIQAAAFVSHLVELDFLKIVCYSIKEWIFMPFSVVLDRGTNPAGRGSMQGDRRIPHG